MQTIVKYFVALLLLLLSQFISSPESKKTLTEKLIQPSEDRIHSLCELRKNDKFITLES